MVETVSTPTEDAYALECLFETRIERNNDLVIFNLINSMNE